MSQVYSSSKENLLNSHVLLLQYHFFCFRLERRHFYRNIILFTPSPSTCHKLPLRKVPICRNAVHCTTWHIQRIIIINMLVFLGKRTCMLLWSLVIFTTTSQQSPALIGMSVVFFFFFFSPFHFVSCGKKYIRTVCLLNATDLSLSYFVLYYYPSSWLCVCHLVTSVIFLFHTLFNIVQNV